MLGNYLTSAIRTGVPGLIGALLAWLAAANINAPAGTTQWLTALLTFVLLLVYYLAVRALESRWPQLGWLLGTPTKPTYSPTLSQLPAAPYIAPAPAPAKKPPAKRAAAKKTATKASSNKK